MAKRERERGQPVGVEAVYEGPSVLDALLAQAGSPYRAGDVVSRFRHALEHGAGRDAAIPALFPDEPHFASPDDARRLYGNLFGLWHRVRAGRGAEDDAPVPAASAAPPEPPPPLPARGTERGRQVSPPLVEAVWRHLDALPQREKQRQRDRFSSAQPDLAAWVEALALDDVGSVAAQDLVFECWAMLDQAFGDALHAVPFAALRARETEPPPLEHEQPALAAYVTEVLGLVADEEPGFGPAARAQVERAVATAVAALGATREA
jgi:hypothetical protein